jgi:hypothetical protein
MTRFGSLITSTVISFSVALQPKSGPGRLVLRFLDHTQLDTHTGRTPLKE